MALPLTLAVNVIALEPIAQLADEVIFTELLSVGTYHKASIVFFSVILVFSKSYSFSPTHFVFSEFNSNPSLQIVSPALLSFLTFSISSPLK